MINSKDFHRSTMPHDIITALRRFNFTVETDYTYVHEACTNLHTNLILEANVYYLIDNSINRPGDHAPKNPGYKQESSYLTFKPLGIVHSPMFDTSSTGWGNYDEIEV